MSCPVHLAFRRRLPNWVQYDWLGNQTATDDDSHGFYDRSLGTVTNSTASQKPYQLAGAEQTTGTKTGALATKYDDAGNLVAMAVRRDGPCYPEGAVCSQQYRYEWDEVGRLVEAKLWDVQGPSLDSAPVGQAAAHLRYGYDASDNRVIKTATDDQGEQVHTVYIFGSLELRRAQFDAVESPNDYTDDIDTEVGYLFGNGVRLARLHWDDNGSPAVGGANLHVLFELGDHLGSSSKVLDKSTSELVEASTYMGYGQAESDYRPGRWKSFREDYRFTGKEEDSEVGLTYFGKRFLSSQLGRWVSADPLVLHCAIPELVLYGYVRGMLLKATDPVGLFDDEVVGSHIITGLNAMESAGFKTNLGTYIRSLVSNQRIEGAPKDLKSGSQTANATYDPVTKRLLIKNATPASMAKFGLGTDSKQSERSATVFHEGTHAYIDEHKGRADIKKHWALAIDYYKEQLEGKNLGRYKTIDDAAKDFADEAIANYVGNRVRAWNDAYQALKEKSSDGTLDQNAYDAIKLRYNWEMTRDAWGYSRTGDGWTVENRNTVPIHSGIKYVADEILLNGIPRAFDQVGAFTAFKEKIIATPQPAENGKGP